MIIEKFDFPKLSTLPAYYRACPSIKHLRVVDESDIQKMDIKRTQDFMDSKGYQLVDVIKIDYIFLKKK